MGLSYNSQFIPKSQFHELAPFGLIFVPHNPTNSDLYTVFFSMAFYTEVIQFHLTNHRRAGWAFLTHPRFNSLSQVGRKADTQYTKYYTLASFHQPITMHLK